MVECEARGERGPICCTAPTQMWNELEGFCYERAMQQFVSSGHGAEFDFWVDRSNEAYARALCLMHDDEGGHGS